MSVVDGSEGGPYDVGDVVRIVGRFRDDAGTLVNPDELTFVVRSPDTEDEDVTYVFGDAPGDDGVEIVQESTGVFYLDYPPLASGVWGYRWIATGVVVGAEPGLFVVRQPFLVLWRPVPDRVATELRARTYETGDDGSSAGERPGVFTANTNPTYEQVQAHIDGAVADVHSAIGENIPDRYIEDLRRVAEIRTAALIERSYIPEQSEETQSNTIYQTLRLEYEDAIKKLAKNVEMALHADLGFL